MMISPGFGLPRDVGRRLSLKFGAFYCRAFDSSFHAYMYPVT